MKTHLAIKVTAVFLSAIASITFWQYFDNQVSSQPNQNYSNMGEATIGVSQDSGLDKKQKVSQARLGSPKSAGDIKSFRTQEVQDWQQRQFSVFNNVAIHSDYKGYDVETLKVLASEGDIVALDFLGYNYAISSEYLKSAQAYKESAVYGSTAALFMLSILKRGLAADPKIPFSRDREIFTYLQTAYLRGDREALNQALEYLDKKEVKFTKKDVEYIQKNGKRVFSELAEGRKNKNLPKFENNFPSFMIKYNQQVENESMKLLEGEHAIFIRPQD